ncbi:MAG: PspC domain-containing protein [Patescibacteria group bacterium]
MKTYNKKLYRSDDNKVIFGVIGGLGEYFDVDPVLLRVGYVLLCIFTAVVPGILAYLLMALVVPKKPETIHADNKTSE